MFFLGDKRRRRKSWRDKRPRVCFTWRPPLTASALLAPSSSQRKTKTAEPEISTTHRKYFWHSNIGLGKEQTYHQRDVLFICVLRRPEVNIHRDISRLLSWGFITKRLWQRVWKKDFWIFNSEVPFKRWNRGLCTAHSIHPCTHWVYPETIQLCLTFWPDKGVFSLQVTNCTNSFCNVWRHCNEIRWGI